MLEQIGRGAGSEVIHGTEQNDSLLIAHCSFQENRSISNQESRSGCDAEML